MGYYSTISPSVKFQSKEKYEEFKKLSDEEKSIGMNPFFENSDIYENTGYGENFAPPLALDVGDCYVKMQDYEIWIPFFAKFLVGTIEVEGEESYDLWKIEFVGDGSFKIYEGVVTFEEVEVTYG